MHSFNLDPSAFNFSHFHPAYSEHFMIHPDPSDIMSNTDELEMRELAKKMRESIEVKNRSYHLKSYPKVCACK